MTSSHTAPRLAIRGSALSRRGALARGGGLAVALVATPGFVAAQEATTGEMVITGEFVGAIPPTSGDHADELFIAVVADALLPAATQRRVRAYVCDGQALDEWFVGEVAGNGIRFASDGDATIDAELSGEGVTGTVTLANGEAHAFGAAPPTGRGGLYNLYIREDRSAFGASASGTALFLTIVGEQAESRFLLSDGQTEVAVAPVLAYPEVGEVAARLIALDAADSHLRGTTRARAGTKSFIRVCEA